VSILYQGEGENCNFWINHHQIMQNFKVVKMIN